MAHVIMMPMQMQSMIIPYSFVIVPNWLLEMTVTLMRNVWCKAAC